MATPIQPTPDPASLGADAQPAVSARDDAHDMSPVLADADSDQGRPFAAPPAGPRQGSAFDQQRQQGAADDPAPGRPDVGHAPGLGHTGTNGDEDRTYDQNGVRGGLGSSGGRENPGDHQPAPDPNPFTGGYDGGGQHQPPADQTQHLGLNTPDPTPDSGK